ncbi:MAG: hypothetical protein KatS3mg042_1125 [Rhodothermaceae bacterium]|nr:MAG: hypothetical protein KatS3mg042_1125 [Rhodothermaceae bacterium]
MSTSPPHDRPATRDRLERLARAGWLSPAALARALRLAGHTPDVMAACRFVDRALLVAGAAFVLAGIVFFFAYNWAGMGPLTKLALIEGVLVLMIGAAWRWAGRPAGQVALVAAVVLVGAFLAVFGQVYPSAAAAYELFGTWAVLVAPWVMLGRLPVLWLLWLALLDATVLAHGEEVVGPENWPATMLYVALMHAGALVAWELGVARGVAWLRGRWGPALIAATGLAALTFLVTDAIFAGYRLDGARRLALGVYVAGVLLMLVYYRSRRDVLLMAPALLSGLVVVLCVLLEQVEVQGWGGLVVGLAMAALSAGAAAWLRAVAREEVP